MEPKQLGLESWVLSWRLDSRGRLVRASVTWVEIGDLFRLCSDFLFREAREIIKSKRMNNLAGEGIEPPYAAWEAAVLPLNYTRR